jgi:hypothetical protein
MNQPSEKMAFAQGALLMAAIWVLWCVAWFHHNPPCPDPDAHQTQDGPR